MNLQTLLFATLALAALAHQEDVGVRIGEGGLRRSAISAPAPEYPRASLARKAEGVVVAVVVFGADGKTREVNVLEAPDDDIREAVRAAVMRWTWAPVTVGNDPRPRAGQGKLTFYFRIAGGKGGVVSPEFAPRPVRTTPRSGAASVAQHGHGGRVTLITETELAKTTPAPVILDIGERVAFRRGHRDGAINIPYDELEVRGPMELDRHKLHVVDCTRDERRLCDIAHEILADKGFLRLAVLVR